MTDGFPAVLDRLLDRQALGEGEAQAVLDQALEGQLGPERLAAFVTAVRAKGTTVDELVGFARSLRSHAHVLRHRHGDALLDTCGTGGAPRKSCNLSTPAAFVANAAGLAVAKHGNRSVTRPTGSADVLEAAGAHLDLAPAQVGRILDGLGFAFLFAPVFHPAMRHAAPVRQALGVRTVFNLLGPLANPAGATHQVLGVHDPALLRPMAEALIRLGCRGGFVLHGDPGFDEATPAGDIHYMQISDGRMGPPQTAAPEALGVPRAPPEALAPVPREQSAPLLRAILDGRERGPRADAVALNAAFTLVAGDLEHDLGDAVGRAREILAAGAARHKLEAFIAATRSAPP